MSIRDFKREQNNNSFNGSSCGTNNFTKDDYSRIKESNPIARIANVAQFEKAFAAAVPTLTASMLQAQESPLLIKCTATGTQMQLVLTNKNPSTRPQMSAKTD